MVPVTKEISTSSCPVVEFYTGKTVFITGATGFMGKVLVEKLLRVTQVSKIYLLIRPKKGQSTEQRLSVLLNSKIFDWVRKDNPQALKKVEAIGGDITEERLGISQEEERLLSASVNIVFHSAATVRFDEDLSKSIGMNVAGVLAVLTLAKEMSQLEAMVDVSTAYCNCDRQHIEERIYPSPGDATGMLDLCKWIDPEILDSREVTKKMVGNRPNTYTFTKALAEDVLSSHCGSLPVSIMRPSIVSASVKEPCPGWVDNYNGPSGVLAAVGKGILRTLYSKRCGKADLVPVDICINLLCCIAWKTASSPRGSGIKVYNCTSGGLNSLTWGEVEVWAVDSVRKVAFEGALWYPGITIREWAVSHRMSQLLFHYGPAHCLDLLCTALGKKPFLVRASTMVQKSTKVLEPFTRGSWTWSNNNTMSLEEELTEGDRAVFGFDVRGIHWKTYFDHYAHGIRNHVLREDPASQSSCRRKLMFLYLADLFIQVWAVLALLWLFYRVLLSVYTSLL